MFSDRGGNWEYTEERDVFDPEEVDGENMEAPDDAFKRRNVKKYIEILSYHKTKPSTDRGDVIQTWSELWKSPFGKLVLPPILSKFTLAAREYSKNILKYAAIDGDYDVKKCDNDHINCEWCNSLYINQIHFETFDVTLMLCANCSVRLDYIISDVNRIHNLIYSTNIKQYSHVIPIVYAAISFQPNFADLESQPLILEDEPVPIPVLIKRKTAPTLVPGESEVIARVKKTKVWVNPDIEYLLEREFYRMCFRDGIEFETSQAECIFCETKDGCRYIVKNSDKHICGKCISLAKALNQAAQVVKTSNTKLDDIFTF